MTLEGSYQSAASITDVILCHKGTFEARLHHGFMFLKTAIVPVCVLLRALLAW